MSPPLELPPNLPPPILEYTPFQETLPVYPPADIIIIPASPDFYSNMPINNAPGNPVYYFTPPSLGAPIPGPDGAIPIYGPPAFI
jgi:hypothetical protein